MSALSTIRKSVDAPQILALLIESTSQHPGGLSAVVTEYLRQYAEKDVLGKEDIYATATDIRDNLTELACAFDEVGSRYEELTFSLCDAGKGGGDGKTHQDLTLPPALRSHAHRYTRREMDRREISQHCARQQGSLRPTESAVNELMDERDAQWMRENQQRTVLAKLGNGEHEHTIDMRG